MIIMEDRNIDAKLLLLISALSKKVDELTNDNWICDASLEEVEYVDKLLQASNEMMLKHVPDIYFKTFGDEMW
jgi:hypothetical protein